jgi:hypothetical protein
MIPKYLNLLEPKVSDMNNRRDNQHLTAKDSTEEIF